MNPKQLESREKLILAYIQGQPRNQDTVKDLATKLSEMVAKFKPNGFMLLQNEVFDSSKLGQRYLLPYGPNNTHKVLPEHPFSIDGTASGTVVVVAYCLETAGE